jgi:hypothetical protein
MSYPWIDRLDETFVAGADSNEAREEFRDTWPSVSRVLRCALAVVEEAQRFRLDPMSELGRRAAALDVALAAVKESK